MRSEGQKLTQLGSAKVAKVRPFLDQKFKKLIYFVILDALNHKILMFLANVHGKHTLRIKMNPVGGL